jgi:hypothetical protein
MVSNVKPGDWVQGSEKFIDDTCKKATGGGTAIPRGKVAVLDPATGIWSLAPAVAQAVGVHGVVTHTNLDSDPTLCIMKGGGTVYVTFDGAVSGDERVATSGTNAGNVIAYAAPAAGVDTGSIPLGKYKGHADEGDGSADHPKTDTVATDVAKLELSGY